MCVSVQVRCHKLERARAQHAKRPEGGKQLKNSVRGACVSVRVRCHKPERARAEDVKKSKSDKQLLKYVSCACHLYLHTGHGGNQGHNQERFATRIPQSQLLMSRRLI
jgi:hypothetical protein